MQIFNYDRVYNFAGKQKPILAITLFISLCAIALMIFRAPNYGIDFTGGTVIQVRYAAAAPIEQMRQNLAGTRFNDAMIQEFGSPQEVVIKAPASTNALGLDVGDEMRTLLQGTGDFEIRRVDMVGARVGSELREAGVMAVIVAFVGILLYVTFRFEWRFAVAAVVATMHDLIFVIGFVILFDVPTNLDILAGLLTILGYSLNDTIVVFDRIRDTIAKKNGLTLAEVINDSVSRTLSRTTLTSLTTLLVVVMTYLFGGELLKPLSLILIVGIVIGTFSSIFVAASLLGILGFDVNEWKNKEARKAQAKAEKERLRGLYEKGTL